MAAPNAMNEPSHEDIVKHVAQVLSDRGFSDICANLPGSKVPPRVTRADKRQVCVPDLAARGNKLMLMEVETTSTLAESGPAERWPLLSQYASRNNAEFIVIVPEPVVQSATDKTRQLRVTAQVIGV